MSTLFEYLWDALRLIGLKGLFIKLYTGSNSYVVLSNMIIFCGIFGILLYIIKRVVRSA